MVNSEWQKVNSWQSELFSKLLQLPYTKQSFREKFIFAWKICQKLRMNHIGKARSDNRLPNIYP